MIATIITDLNISIKDWYIKNFSNDEVGRTLSSTATFLDLNNLLNSNRGSEVYTLLGGDADTVVRERCFQKLAELTNQDYDVIYYKWLNAPDKILEEEYEK